MHLSADSTTYTADNILLYQIQAGDIMDTSDGSDLSIDCTGAYGEELSQQAMIMANQVEDLIKSDVLCGNNQTLTELVHASSLAAIGSKVNM